MYQQCIKLFMSQSPQTYQFYNPVCKQTYNSLPKIYGNFKNKKSFLHKKSASINIGHNRYASKIKSQQTEIASIKKPMKFHLQRYQLLSAPRHSRFLTQKKDDTLDSCPYKQQKSKVFNKKKNYAKKLKPLKPVLTEPDDTQSTYKVQTKKEENHQKIGNGLLNLIQSYSQNKLQCQTQVVNSISQRNMNNFIHSDVEVYSATTRLLSMKQNEKSFINELDSELETKRVPVDENEEYNIDLNEKEKEREIINQKMYNDAVAQVNFNDALQLHTEESKDSKLGRALINQNQKDEQNVQGEETLICNVKTQTKQCYEISAMNQIDNQDQKQQQDVKTQKKQEQEIQRNQRNQEEDAKKKQRESQFKKLQSIRKKKYIEDQKESEKGKTQYEYNKKDKQKAQDVVQDEESNNETYQKSRISSSISLTQVIAKGLGKSRTVFKELLELEARESQNSNSRLLDKKGEYSEIGTQKDGRFIIPERKNYGRYLKQYSTIDKKIFNINKVIKSPLFKIVQEKDSLYFGEVENQQKQGLGLNINGKEIFEGIYDKNMKIKGSQHNVDGIYKGYFKNGKREGYGLFQWNNGEKFQGNWREGVKEGFGIWTSPKGSRYEGQWQNNRQHGQGTFKHHNSTYKGQFKNFLKHGYGEQKFINGDCYTGQYKYGKPDGSGLYKWYNGSTYQGQFKNGLRNGYGKWSQQEISNNPNKQGNKCRELEVYTGYFKDDCKQGQGKQIIKKTGQKFEGQFKEGERIKGILYYEDGTVKQIIRG